MTKTVTAEINDETFQIIEDFATRQGLSTATVLSSVAQSYAEWYIPGISRARHQENEKSKSQSMKNPFDR